MKKTTLQLGALALGVSILGASTGTVMAYRGDPTVISPQYSEERHEDMTRAFETNNYALWKSLMDGKGNVTRIINEDNFVVFAKAHTLAKEGKIEEAKEIRRELGLGLRNGNSNAQKGRGMHREVSR
jgi:hypothetical protein